MLQELSKHEERENEREALTTSSALLTGHAVRVHQMQGWIHGVVTAHNLQTRVRMGWGDGGRKELES